jgi:MFS family permease
MKKPRLQLYRGLPKEIYLLFAVRVVNTVGSFVMPLIAMILTEKIGLSSADAGSFTTLVCLTQAPCLLIGGKLIDVFGRRRMILLFNTLGALSYMACALVAPGRAMAALILLASDFYVFSWPAFDAVTADVAEGDARKQAFSFLYLGTNLGYAVGPVLGGLLFKDHLSLLFFLDGLTTLLSTALVLLLPETKNRSLPAEPRENGVTEKTGTLRVLWRTPILALFLLILLLYDFTYAQYGFTLPLQMDSLFSSAGPRLYSTLISVNAVVVIVFTPLITKLSARVRPLPAMAGGGALFFASFLLFAVSSRMAAFYAAMALFTFGEIVTTINTGVYIADATPPTHRGRINSASNLVRGTGYAVGPVAMGHLLEKTSYFWGWLFIAGLMGLGAALMFLLGFCAKRKSKKTRPLKKYPRVPSDAGVLSRYVTSTGTPAGPASRSPPSSGPPSPAPPVRSTQTRRCRLWLCRSECPRPRLSSSPDGRTRASSTPAPTSTD